MRTFGQVPTRLWRDKRFRTLSDEYKLALLSLWCGPDSASAGVMRLEDGYAALALDWPPEKWQAARMALESAGLIKRNADTDEILICGFFEVNRPSNDRARVAVAKQIEAIECIELRQQAEAALQARISQPTAAAEPKAKPWGVTETGALHRGNNVR